MSAALLCATILGLPATAATLDFTLEAPAVAARWSFHTDRHAQALPILTIPATEGEPWTVIANLLGEEDGEAIVQVQVLREGDDGEGRQLKTVLRGDDELRLVGDLPFLFAMSQQGRIEPEPAEGLHLELLLPASAPIAMIGHLADRWGDMEPLHPGALANVARCDVREGPRAHVMFLGEYAERVHEELREALRYSLAFPYGRRTRAGSRAAGSCSWTTAEGEGVSHSYQVLFM